MEIPKHIEEALETRRQAALDYMSADYQISQFIQKNGLEGDILEADYGTGVESLANPTSSMERIRNAILSKIFVD